MKKLGDLLVGKNPFKEILMGNEAIVRAMIETGTMVVASYPGSPTPEIAAAIQSIPEDKRPFYFEFSVNEKVARTIVFEPASPWEAYEYYKYAETLAKTERTVVVVRLTTHVCHARQKISVDAYTDKNTYQTDFNPQNGPYIALTSMALDMKRESIKRLHRSKKYIKDAGLNQVFVSNNNHQKEIITSGLPYFSVLDVFEKARFRPDILKLGAVNPLEETCILSFLKTHDQVLILEELDDILEVQIKSLAYDSGLKTRVIGKTEDDDYVGEYTPDKTMDKISHVWPDMIKHNGKAFVLPIEVSARPAQMCPGCGHRSAFFAIKKALADEDVTVADIGCHTLGYMPPYNI